MQCYKKARKPVNINLHTKTTEVVCPKCDSEIVFTVHMELTEGETLEHQCICPFCGKQQLVARFQSKLKPKISILDMMCDSILI